MSTSSPERRAPLDTSQAAREIVRDAMRPDGDGSDDILDELNPLDRSIVGRKFMRVELPMRGITEYRACLQAIKAEATAQLLLIESMKEKDRSLLLVGRQRWRNLVERMRRGRV